MEGIPKCDDSIESHWGEIFWSAFSFHLRSTLGNERVLLKRTILQITIAKLKS